MNIWKKIMDLFGTSKQVEITPLVEESVIEEVKIDDQTNLKVEEVLIEDVKESKPKRRRYYPKKPKASSSDNSGERPNSKPKRSEKK